MKDAPTDYLTVKQSVYASKLVPTGVWTREGGASRPNILQCVPLQSWIIATGYSVVEMLSISVPLFYPVPPLQNTGC